MAEIHPFRGLRYNPQEIKNLAEVISPPFDVISEAEQEMYYRRSDHNVVRLILGRKRPRDTDQDNPHSRAAAYLHRWCREHILVRDTQPALYLTALDFEHQGRRVTRMGLVGSVRLVPFDERVIMPHERTFTKVKAERLELMKHCHANFSPIFAIYDDGRHRIAGVIDNVVEDPPVVQFTDHGGFGHRLWRIRDAEMIRAVTASMHDMQLVIADGHHRYETALNYRDWAAAREPRFNGNHPANYVMMQLTRIQDPGLLILPAHRLLKDIAPSTLADFERKAGGFFDIQTFPIEAHRRDIGLQSFLNRLQGDADRHAIGVYLKGSPAWMLLTLKEGVRERRLAAVESDTLRRVDVNVLTELVFIQTLGFDRDRLDDQRRIAYTVRAAEAIDAVDRGLCDAAFILNPTTVEQVCRVAAEGQVMPRKATYFYPKVTTGLVMRLWSAE